MAIERRTQADRSAETSGKILLAAQKLFSQRGFEGVTMRAIAAEAAVNLASIVYYFENKEGLYLAVFRHYAEPLMRERMKMLEQADLNPSPRAYARAFIEPAFRILLDEKLGGPDHARLLWRLQQEPQELIVKIYQEFHAPVLEQMRQRMQRYWDDEAELSWHVHIMGAVFLATLGRFVSPINIQESDSWLQAWKKDKDHVLDMIVDTAVKLIDGKKE